MSNSSLMKGTSSGMPAASTADAVAGPTPFSSASTSMPLSMLPRPALRSTPVRRVSHRRKSYSVCLAGYHACKCALSMQPCSARTQHQQRMRCTYLQPRMRLCSQPPHYRLCAVSHSSGFAVDTCLASASNAPIRDTSALQCNARSSTPHPSATHVSCSSAQDTA